MPWFLQGSIKQSIEWERACRVGSVCVCVCLCACVCLCGVWRMGRKWGEEQSVRNRVWMSASERLRNEKGTQKCYRRSKWITSWETIFFYFKWLIKNIKKILAKGLLIKWREIYVCFCQTSFWNIYFSEEKLISWQQAVNQSTNGSEAAVCLVLYQT